MSRSLVVQDDCIEFIRSMDPDSIDAIVCDPPYELTSGKKGGSGVASINLDSPYGRARIGTGTGGFMGKSWDATGIAFDPEMWDVALQALKPGGYLIAFGGTRTFHRLTCAIEDSGFEIRDCLMWLYGTGFPKSMDISKAIDKKLGVDRPVVGKSSNWGASNAEAGKTTYGDYKGKWDITAPGSSQAQRWNGWGTALKPAWEPIILARKPFRGTVADNVLRYGTGGVNIDDCRIETSDSLNGGAYAQNPTDRDQMWGDDAANSYRRGGAGDYVQPEGRFPANLLLTHSPDCELDDCHPDCPAALLDEQSNQDRVSFIAERRLRRNVKLVCMIRMTKPDTMTIRL